MNKAALVTGGAQRIGRRIVERLAAEGYAVAIHCRRSTERGARRWPSGSARRAAGPPSSRPISRTRLPSERLVPEAVRALGPLTLLVNNASEFEPDEVETLSQERWDRHFAVNLRAPAFLARDFARQLPAGARGLHRQHRRPARLEADAAVLLLHADEGGPVHAPRRPWRRRSRRASASTPSGRVPTLSNVRQGEEDFAKQSDAVLLGPWRNAGRDRRRGGLSGRRAQRHGPDDRRRRRPASRLGDAGRRGHQGVSAIAEISRP